MVHLLNSWSSALAHCAKVHAVASSYDNVKKSSPEKYSQSAAAPEIYTALVEVCLSPLEPVALGIIPPSKSDRAVKANGSTGKWASAKFYNIWVQCSRISEEKYSTSIAIHTLKMDLSTTVSNYEMWMIHFCLLPKSIILSDSSCAKTSFGSSIHLNKIVNERDVWILLRSGMVLTQFNLHSLKCQIWAQNVLSS